ncbi:MAG TPA: hypothetical protein VF270_02080 [Ignavibacteriaceae bacterium]|jgi:hypothetical protein
MNNSKKDILKSDIKSELNKELINRIKEIQDLPTEVIIKFIKAAGALAETNFGKKTSDGH